MTNTTQPLVVSDLNSGTVSTFAADAAGYQAAFEEFCTDEQRRKLAGVLADGCVFESWSGKSTSVIERDREPLRYWLTLCSLIETDNQMWSVGPIDTGEDA